jgi:hypothetical protein
MERRGIRRRGVERTGEQGEERRDEKEKGGRKRGQRGMHPIRPTEGKFRPCSMPSLSLLLYDMLHNRGRLMRVGAVEGRTAV